MKITKRVFSLLLSLCMLCGCVIMPTVMAEGEEAAAETEPTTSESIEKLDALGIWSDGYIVSAELSRGDLAVLLAGMLGFSDSSISSEPVFLDVQPGDNCYGAVMFLYGIGVFSPADDGLFHPEEKPTYEQIVKIMTELTGYGVMAQVNGGYPAGYLTAANRYDLLPSSFMGNPKEVYTLGDIADVLAYVIDVPIMEQGTYGSSEQYYINEEKTLLGQYHNIYLHEGVMTSVQGRRLYADLSCGKNQVMIDDQSYWIGDAVPSPELMGYAVKAYYRTDGRSNDDATIVYIEKNLQRNRDYTIQGDLITSYTNGIVTYYRNESASNTSSLEIRSNMSVMYNYNYTNGFEDNDIIQADRLVLIDSNNDGSYDVLNIVYYETFFVKSVDTVNFKVYDKYGAAALDLNTNDDSKTVDVFDVNSQSIDPTAIPVKSVLSVLRDKDLQHITVYISDLKQTGQVSTVKNAENAEEVTYTIDGEEFELANNYDRVDFIGDIRVGDYVTLYLTREGKIGGLEKEKAAEDYFYGYVSGAATESGPFEDTVRLLIYNDMGELLKLPLESEVNITGIGRQKSENIVQMLRDNSSNPNSVKQLIKYKVNSENVITEITLPTRISDEQLLSDNSAMNRYINLQDAYYNKEYNVFYGKLRVDENTKIMYVPVSEAYVQEIDFYGIQDMNDFPSGNYNIESYDVEPDRTAGVIVVRGDFGLGNELQYNSACSVVKDIISAVDEDGVPITQIEVIRNSEELVFNMAETCSTTQYYRGENGPVACEIKKGDIIRFGTDSEGNISDWYKVFSVNDEDDSAYVIRGFETEDRKGYLGSSRTMIEYRGNAENPDTDVISGRVWQGRDNQYNFVGVNFLANFGIVDEKINSILYINTYGGTEGAEQNRNYRTYMKPSNIVVIDMPEDEIRKGTIDDIHAAQDVGFDEASRVLTFKYQEQPTLLVVVKR